MNYPATVLARTYVLRVVFQSINQCSLIITFAHGAKQVLFLVASVCESVCVSVRRKSRKLLIGN